MKNIENNKITESVELEEETRKKMNLERQRRQSCEDRDASPCSSDRSSPGSIEVDSPGPSRSPSPARGGEAPRSSLDQRPVSAGPRGPGSPFRASELQYEVSVSGTKEEAERHRVICHAHEHGNAQSHSHSPGPSPTPARTSNTSTNPRPKLSFGISRILSEDEPVTKSKASVVDSHKLLSPVVAVPSSDSVIKPTDLRLHSVVVPHPLHRGLSVVVPHPHPHVPSHPAPPPPHPSHGSAATNGHLSPTEGNGAPAPPPAHHHPPSLTPGGFFPSPASSSLSALDLQTITSIQGAAGGVIRVPAHRPMNLPPGVGMSPMMFPWMQDRKDRLTGEQHSDSMPAVCTVLSL